MSILSTQECVKLFFLVLLAPVYVPKDPTQFWESALL